jgi:hypothetical protein
MTNDPMRFQVARLLAFGLWTGVLCGCAGGDSYPQTTAAAAIGREAHCDHCGQSIASVAREHLFPFQGVQYTVCNEECSRKLAHSIKHGTLK